ncbi:DUF6304 family protein [Streptomyces sp. NPDC046887]|uniref:DUF6304 family protein n=1 Tax=Streptomyces sp. NPDC046887 TaxID=3155472 RepID=UPI0033FFC377
MPDETGYESPLRVRASVTDRWGSTGAFLTNDGKTFTLEFRDNRFEGASPDGLELVAELEHSLEPPDLDGRDLCGYWLGWSTPVRVRSGSATEYLSLHTDLVVPDPRRPETIAQPYGVRLKLERDGEAIADSGWADDVEQGLWELRRDAPDGIALQTCANCAFSDYHPGGYALMGSLGCFRNKKEEFRAVRSKFDLIDLWDDRAGDVQETHSCADFTDDPAKAPSDGDPRPSWPDRSAALRERLESSGGPRANRPAAPWRTAGGGDRRLLITRLPAEAGEVADLAPVAGAAGSVWLLLGQDGRLVRFDADRSTADTVGSVRLPEEAPHPHARPGGAPRRRLHASPDGRFAAVVHDFGRSGQLLDLRTGRVVLPLDGGDHRAYTVPFAFAFTERAGRTLAVHRTAWNRLDVSDAETGAPLTPREPDGARPLDYFHGALAVSPGGTRIADDGWVWGPHGVPTVWNLRNWTAGRTGEAETGRTRKELAHRPYYWNNPQCWIDERRIAISGIGEAGSAIRTLRAGVRVFDAVRRRELTVLLGVRGRLFAADGTLYAAAPDGLDAFDPDTGERTGGVPGFVPTHHHRGAGELVEHEGGVLVRWRL